MPKSFVIVIPSFNNLRWYRQNLDSVLHQEHPSFRVIYVDDASTDGTGPLVKQYVAQSGAAERVTFIQNEERRGAAANIDRAVRTCDAKEIVLLVDGDDFLAHRRVLARLETIYADPNVWLTWGQFIRFPLGSDGFCEPIPDEIVSANAFRDHPFVTSHLRTFYAALYQRIRTIDLKDSDGNFLSIACDVAHMFAMLEMAGSRAKFVSEVLYRYNRENPINDDKVDRQAQLRTEMEIRGKVRYGRVASLAGDSPPNEFHVVSGVGRTFFEGAGLTDDAEERRRPFRQMRSVLNRLGHSLRETQTVADIQNAPTIAVFDVRPDELESLARYPNSMPVLFLWKDPIAAPQNYDRRYHEPFQRIYTWQSDLIDNVRYFKFHYPFMRRMMANVAPFESRKLCTLVASNQKSEHPDELYSEERRVVEFFTAAEPDSFDLFGWGWNREVNPNYGGYLPKRVDRLRRYKFSFCYETVRGWNGLVSGKIFDSFAAGCVPIYLGAPDIAATIPPDCFIARDDFGSDAELHAFLAEMSQETHEGYLARIRAYLSSERAMLYSPQHFVRTFVDLVGGRPAPAGARPAAEGAPSAGAVGAVDSST